MVKDYERGLSIDKSFFSKELWRNILLGVLVLVAGLSSMTWGAYSSCVDGGGRLRGIVPYYQCVLNSSNDVVPYMDQVSIKDVPSLCAQLRDVSPVGTKIRDGYWSSARRDLNSAVDSRGVNVTVFGQNITLYH